MNIPIELTPEYQEQAKEWQRTHGYAPQHDTIVRILAKKKLREELRRLFDEIKTRYNISGREFKQAAKEATQTLAHDVSNKEANQGRK